MENVTLQHIHKTLSSFPGLPELLKMEDAMRFVRLASSLRRTILHAYKPGDNIDKPPDCLPDSVQDFLGSAVGLTPEYVHGCWVSLKDTIWAYDSAAHSNAADARLFYSHGRQDHLRKGY